MTGLSAFESSTLGSPVQRSLLYTTCQVSPSFTVSKERGMVVTPIIQKPQLEPPQDLIQAVQSGSCSAPMTSSPPVGTFPLLFPPCWPPPPLLSLPPHAARTSANVVSSAK